MDGTAEPAAIVRGLATTLDWIRAASQGLSAAQLQAPPTPGAWSPNEILWHIRATADVYGEHISRILDEDQPRWRHVSPRARMKKLRYDQLPFVESFADFERQRSDLVARLGGLAPEAWQRYALVRVDHRHDRELPLTLQKRVAGMLQHEQIHCAQMEQVAAALGQPSA